MARMTFRNKRLLLTAVQVILVLVVLYLVLTKLLAFFAPFLVALFIAFLIEKPVQFLQRKCRFSRGAASAVSLLLFVILAGGLIGFLFYRLFMEVWDLTRNSSGYQFILVRIQELLDEGGTWYTGLPEEIVNSIENNFKDIFQRIGDTVTNWIKQLLEFMITVLTSLPQALLYIIITLVSAFFMSRDRDKISQFIFGQFSPDWRERARGIKNDLLLALTGYIKAVLILVTISFFEVLIGYNILGIRYSLFLAILTAVADLLPILGPGTILIPGAIINFISGEYFIAMGFFILYIIVTMVRQFLEPRIVGGNIGLHPLATLVSIYIGFRLFGVAGIIMGPIFAIVIRSLQKARILPQWKGMEGSRPE
jgi:sporulation integral membrane protein YtvI